MKHLTVIAATLLVSSAVFADDVSNTSRLLCSQAQVMLCLHSAECALVAPETVETPRFVIIDTRKKTVATTRASGDGRSSRGHRPASGPHQLLRGSSSITGLP